MKTIGINTTNTPRLMGGAYQYSIKLTRALVENDTENRYIIFHSDDSILSEYFNNKAIKFVKVPNNPLEPLAWKFKSTVRILIQTHFTLYMNRLFNRFKIDLLIQPSHHNAYKANIPYILAIHDVVPQYIKAARKNMGKQWLLFHDYLVKIISKKAKKILVDTQYSKKIMMKYYNLEFNKIIVLPFRAPDYANPKLSDARVEEIINKYNLPENYIYYPSTIAKFKNHLGLLRALNEIRKSKDINLSLVMTGSKSDAWDIIDNYIKNNRLSENVYYLGYIPDEDISALYKKAIAMVMPTFVGPSSIPVLEAFTMGCPVIVSNLPGYDEQVGDAGILINPELIKELVDAILLIYNNEKIRNKKIKKGFEVIKRLNSISYEKQIKSIMLD